MKRAFIYFIFCASIMSPVTGFSENTKTEETLFSEENAMDNSAGTMPEGHYQDRILSDPETNSAARVGIQGGGNTAIINQNGFSNYSSIIQSGNDNYAEQTQNGTDNEIYLEQRGDNNSHTETQTGDQNRKVIIQNDTEAIIQQVSQ